MLPGNGLLLENILMATPGSESQVKCCPWCGRDQLQVFSMRKFIDAYYHSGDCPLSNHSMPAEAWNNAWAHKRIAELEAYIADMESQKECALSHRIAELEKRNADLEDANILVTKNAAKLRDMVVRLESAARGLAEHHLGDGDILGDWARAIWKERP